jgi:hypothetical protein
MLQIHRLVWVIYTFIQRSSYEPHRAQPNAWIPLRSHLIRLSVTARSRYGYGSKRLGSTDWFGGKKLRLHCSDRPVGNPTGAVGKREFGSDDGYTYFPIRRLDTYNRTGPVMAPLIVGGWTASPFASTV